MPEFIYQEMFPLGKDTTEYRLLTRDHVTVKSFEDRDILCVDAPGLTLLARQAFTDVSHLLRPSHLKLTAEIFKDPEASDNDRLVALDMLKNAVISAEGEFPCARTREPASYWAKKASRCLPGTAMKRPCPGEYLRHIPKTICATPRMLR